MDVMQAKVLYNAVDFKYDIELLSMSNMIKLYQPVMGVMETDLGSTDVTTV